MTRKKPVKPPGRTQAAPSRKRLEQAISGRKRAEQALRESEERLRALLGHLPVGVYRTTPEGSIIEGNQELANMLGFEKISDLRQVRVGDFYVHSQARSEHLEKLDSTLIYFGEFELQSRDGRRIWVRDYPRAVSGPDGKIQYYDGILVDVSDRKLIEEALVQSERDYRELFENAHDAILIFAGDKEIILDVNNRACEIYGFDRDELIGMSLETISKDVAKGKARIKNLLEKRTFRNFETVHRRKDGTEMILEVNAALVNYKGQRAILSINRDVTDRKRMEETIRQLAYMDPLTNLPNRMLFTDRFGLALSQAQRKQRLLALMFLDLDRFKQVNDSLGHSVGDQLLKQVAFRLKTLLRKGDTVARMGGDEFLLLLPEIAAVEDAVAIAQKILVELRLPFAVDEHRLSISTSVGIAISPSDGEDPETLMRNADMAMYCAKAAGRDTFRCYEPGMTSD